MCSVYPMEKTKILEELGMGITKTLEICFLSHKKNKYFHIQYTYILISKRIIFIQLSLVPPSKKKVPIILHIVTHSNMYIYKK